MKRPFRRLVVLHPQAVLDATVLIAGGALALGSWLLLRWTQIVDEAQADFGDDDDE